MKTNSAKSASNNFDRFNNRYAIAANNDNVTNTNPTPTQRTKAQLIDMEPMLTTEQFSSIYGLYKRIYFRKEKNAKPYTCEIYPLSEAQYRYKRAHGLPCFFENFSKLGYFSKETRFKLFGRAPLAYTTHNLYADRPWGFARCIDGDNKIFVAMNVDEYRRRYIHQFGAEPVCVFASDLATAKVAAAMITAPRN